MTTTSKGAGSKGGASKGGWRGWVIVGLVSIGAAVAQGFGRFTYSVVLPAVIEDLGINKTLAGTLGTINVGAYLLGTLAVALGTSRIRLLPVMRGGFVFALAGLALAGVAPNAAVLGVALFLTGIGGAFIWIPSPVIAADAVPPERRRLAVGLMGSGIGLGLVFSGQLAGVLRGRYGDGAWRSVYLVQTAIGAAVVIAVLLLVRHQQEKPSGQKAGVGGFTALRRMPNWRPLTAAYTAFGFAYLLVVGFLTTRLEDDSGWTESRSSLAFTLLGLAVVPGGVVMTGLAGRIGAGRLLAGAFVGWSGLALLVLPGGTVLTLAAALALGLMFSGIPSVITLYVVENTSVDDYGPSFSAATLAFGMAQMASPQVGGVVADVTGSFTGVFMLSAAVALVGAAASIQLRRAP